MRDDLPVRVIYTTSRRPRRTGALALFGENYGDEVRVVDHRRPCRVSCAVARTSALIADRSGHAARRVVHRVGCAARRGASRPGGVPVPGTRTRAGPQLAEQFKMPDAEVPARIGSAGRAAAHRGEGTGAAARRPAALSAR